MTGTELLKARHILGISQASMAAMFGANVSQSPAAFTASDVQTAESNANVIANSGLNVAAEKFLRPTLNTAGGV